MWCGKVTMTQSLIEGYFLGITLAMKPISIILDWLLF